MIAVTGATGTNGALVIAELMRRGEYTRALTRHPEKIAKLNHLEAVAFDFDDASTYATALAGVDRAFLVQASNPREPEQERAFIEAAEKAGVRHIVYLSAIGSDAPQTITLGRLHHETEQRLQASKMQWTILRPTNFMQNYLRQAEEIASGVLREATGDAAVSYVDARDTAEIAAQAMTNAGFEGKSFNLTGPAGLTGAQVAQTLSDGLGIKLRFEAITTQQLRDAMLSQQVPEWQVGILAELYDLLQTGRGAAVTDGVQKALGRPARNFADFVVDHRTQLSKLPAHAVRN